MVSLFLSDFGASLKMLSVTNVIELVGVDEPDEWNENRRKNKHERLLLDYTEGMTVVVVMG